MAPRTTAKPRAKPRPEAPAAPDDGKGTAFTLRGLDARDVAALDAYAAKRRAELRDMGATASRNTVAVALLREALRNVGAYDLPAPPAEPGA